MAVVAISPDDLSGVRRELDRSGYCMLPGALTGELLARVRARLIEQAAAERHLHNMKNPANTDPVSQWVGMLLNKGDVFFELVRHPVALALIEHVLGPAFLVSCVDSQIQHPGSVSMPLHTDQWWMPPPVPPGEPPVRPATIERGTGKGLDASPARYPIAPPLVANVMWLISDFTEANGATRLVPGSHLTGLQPDPAVPHPMATIAASGRAGTALVFDGRLWHGAGANRTAEPRYGITTTFCGPQCRQLENYTRGMRPEVLSRCPAEVRDRLGFAAWSSYGHTGDPDTRFSLAGEQCTGELRGGDAAGSAPTSA